jgi:hypothetical protein
MPSAQEIDSNGERKSQKMRRGAVSILKNGKPLLFPENGVKNCG